MKQIGHLKLNGRAFPQPFSRAVERLKQFLRDLPDDEVKDIAGLSVSRFSNATIYKAQPELIEMGLLARHGNRVYYGNKKAILALKAILASQS